MTEQNVDEQMSIYVTDSPQTVYKKFLFKSRMLLVVNISVFVLIATYSLISREIYIMVAFYLAVIILLKSYKIMLNKIAVDLYNIQMFDCDLYKLIDVLLLFVKRISDKENKKKIINMRNSYYSRLANIYSIIPGENENAKKYFAKVDMDYSNEILDFHMLITRMNLCDIMNNNEEYEKLKEKMLFSVKNSKKLKGYKNIVESKIRINDYCMSKQYDKAIEAFEYEFNNSKSKFDKLSNACSMYMIMSKVDNVDNRNLEIYKDYISTYGNKFINFDKLDEKAKKYETA